MSAKNTNNTTIISVSIACVVASGLALYYFAYRKDITKKEEKENNRKESSKDYNNISIDENGGAQNITPDLLFLEKIKQYQEIQPDNSKPNVTSKPSNNKSSKSVFTSPVNKGDVAFISEKSDQSKYLQEYVNELDSSIKKKTKELINVKSPMRVNSKQTSSISNNKESKDVLNIKDNSISGNNQISSQEAENTKSTEIVDPSYIPKLLYIDIFRFAHLIFMPKKDWNVKKAFERVSLFVQTAKDVGITLKCFLDNYSSGMSYGSIQNYKEKIEKDLLIDRKDLPESIIQLLGEMFSKCGVEVVYMNNNNFSITAVILSHALANNADVLTDNREIFNYQSVLKSVKIFSNYSLRKEINKLVLIPFDFTRDNKNINKVDIKNIINVSKYPNLFISNGHYLRGMASPLLRVLPEYTNPYDIVRPLRRAFYYLAGVSGPITEEWIIFEDGQVKWHQETEIDPLAQSIKHMDLLVSLLRNPEEAVRYFFPKESSSNKYDFTTESIDVRLIKERYRDHIFCIRNIVYEICSAASQYLNKPITLLEMWLQFESNGFNKTPSQSTPKKDFDKNHSSGDKRNNNNNNNNKTPGSNNKVMKDKPIRRKPKAIIKYKQPSSDSTLNENDI